MKIFAGVKAYFSCRLDKFWNVEKKGVFWFLALEVVLRPEVEDPEFLKVLHRHIILPVARIKAGGHRPPLQHNNPDEWPAQEPAGTH